MRLAKINGDLKLHSALIEARRFRSSIDATGITVRGSVMAQTGRNNRFGREPLVAFGNVRFRAARVRGQVDFTGAKLMKRKVDQSAAERIQKAIKNGEPRPKYAPTHMWSLDLRQARVGAQVKLDDNFVAEKGVCLRSARIKDRVTILGRIGDDGQALGCTITAPDHTFHPEALNRAIDAFRVEIGGSFYLDGPKAVVEGKIDFSLATIRARFGIGRRAEYDNRAIRGLKNCSMHRLSDIAHQDEAPDHGYWLRIVPPAPPTASKGPTSLATLGTLSLQHAIIGFELIIGPPTIREPAGEQELLASNPVLVRGRVDAVHAEIGYQVYLGRATFEKDESLLPLGQAHRRMMGSSERVPGASKFNAAIDFTAAKVGIDFYVDGSIILGGLCLYSVEVTQDLIFRRGLAYSTNAAEALWRPYREARDLASLDGQVVSNPNSPAVHGTALRRHRHHENTWAITLRHATVRRTVSLRGPFAAVGSLMFMRSQIGGYFELCSIEKTTRSLISSHESMCMPPPDIAPVESCWPATWSINLSGTHASVVWWSLERSGWIDKDHLDSNPDPRSPSVLRSRNSLADLLFINDFTYDNIYFLEASVSEAIISSSLDPADETPVQHSDFASNQWESCKRFLSLQSLPGRTNERRKRLVGKHEKQKPSCLEADYLRRFKPQPYEQLAKVCRSHGQTDLFANCHVEKWNRYTASIAPRMVWGFSVILAFSVVFTLAVVIDRLVPVNTNATFTGRSVVMLQLLGVTFGLLSWVAIKFWVNRHRPCPSSSKRARITGSELDWLTPNGQPVKWSRAVRWASLRIFGFIAGFGYRPGRLVLASVIFIVVGAVFFSHAHRLGVIRPSSEFGDRVMLPPTDPWETDPMRRTLGDSWDDNALRPIVDNDIASDYPAFNAFWYAADLLIPVIGLEQAEYWHAYPFDTTSLTYHVYRDEIERQPPSNVMELSGWSTGLEVIDHCVDTVAQPITRLATLVRIANYRPAPSDKNPWSTFWRSTVGILVYVFEPLYTVTGWILVTMGIASASRLIRHE